MTGKIKNLILSGGGLRCMAYVGALRALEEYGLIQGVEKFAGTSAGAIFATLFSIGYHYTELYDFVRNFNMDNLKDIQILGITENFGLETGLRITRFLESLIKYKTGSRHTTFKEHFQLTGKRLYINATCLDNGTEVFFSVDTHPDMPIVIALRMSIAIPIIISPVRWNN